MIVLSLILIIGFIVFATAKLKWHPFLVLILAAVITAFAYDLKVEAIPKTIADGFGGILGYIGLVIVFGTIIGYVLEKTGAAIVMAQSIVKLLGERFPTLTMSIVGAMVSIPVFCDSAFVILNSLRESLSERLKVSGVAMSVALATGLYATHTFVPPTPGPIAAAGNLGLDNQLGLVIGIGLLVSVVAALVGWLYSLKFLRTQPELSLANLPELDEQALNKYGELPTPFMAFLPIVAPIGLICLASVANFPSKPFGENAFQKGLLLIGHPLFALLIGMLLSFLLIKGKDKNEQISKAIGEGLVVSAPIVLITGAGGAFGAVLKATPVGDYLGQTLSALGLGILMPFVVSAALKSAQGSTTVALVTTSALVAPMLATIGLDSEMGRVLCVMAIGAGAMTVSHANDSYFWVVSQFSKMSVPQAYKTHTVATGIQGVASMVFVWVLSLILL